MNKVKVSKELFDALESTKEWPVSEGKRIELMMNYYSTKRFAGDREIINKLNSLLFLDILRLGYELDLTPHEKVLREYNELKLLLSWAVDREQIEAIENSMKTIVITLNTLKIYIEGVNK